MVDKINDAVAKMLGGDFKIQSFISDKNTNIESVQFVIKTDKLKAETPQYEEKTKAPETLWQKIVDLFRK